MSELIINRTPELIAAEINNIKNQTQRMLLYNSIEIGRRLHEAKALVEHGSWGEWLEGSVNYSQRTANNLMRIFEEYGAAQITLLGDNSNSQALANLSYTQAVALLGVPEEEREEFVKEHDIDNMSTRELQKVIKEKQELEQKLQLAEETKKAVAAGWEGEKKLTEQLKQEKEKAEKDAQEYKQKVEEINSQREIYLQQIQELNVKLSEAAAGDPEKMKQLEAELKQAKNKVDELSKELESVPELQPAVIEKIPDEIQKELEELRQKNKELEASSGKSDTAIVKYTAHFETLVGSFKNILGSLAEIRKTNNSEYDKYKNAIAGLISKMAESL